LTGSISQEESAVTGADVRAKTRRGVYFLANDAILDVTIAFLKSFRIHNPAVPLCLIPFGDDIERLAALGEIYDFSIYSDRCMLERCDEISLKFFDWRCGQFRKLCAFEGEFDEFIYVDCDTIVLNDVYFTFQFLDRADFITSHSDEPHLRQWVWKESIYEAGVLSAQQIAFSANTGYFCSRKGQFTISGLERDLQKSLDVKQHLELGCAEQAYLNHIVVTSGCRYASLKKMKLDSGHWSIPLERWAGDKGRLRSWLGGLRASARAKILLIHWAGMWSAQPSDRAIYAALERFGFPSRTPTVRFFLRHKWLWKYYRHYPYRRAIAGAVRIDAAPTRTPERSVGEVLPHLSAAMIGEIREKRI